MSAIRDVYHAHWIQSDVATTHGSSGGPLFDSYGNVIGICDRNGDNEDKAVNIGLFIPIGEAITSVGVTQQRTNLSKAAKPTPKHATTP